MSKTILLLLLIVILSSAQCHRDKLCPNNEHNVLVIKNTGIKRINHEFYWNYPDSTIPDQNSPIFYGNPVLKPGDSVLRSAGRGGCWESIFTQKSKEWIYFFDQDSLEHIPWETIKATNRGILERRELTLEYLQRNNFTIVYP